MPSINLLPGMAEEKAKSHSKEGAPSIRRIELTNPAKEGKERQSSKGGFFSFLRNLFKKSVPKIEETLTSPISSSVEEKEKLGTHSFGMPKRTLVFAEPTYKPAAGIRKPTETSKPKVIIETVSAPKAPKPEKAKEAGWLSRLFGAKREMVFTPAKPEKFLVSPPPTAKGPSVPSTPLSRPAPAVPKTERETILLTSAPTPPIANVKKPDTKTQAGFFSVLLHWFRRLFSKKPHPLKMNADKTVKPSVPVVPLPPLPPRPPEPLNRPAIVESKSVLEEPAFKKPPVLPVQPAAVPTRPVPPFFTPPPPPPPSKTTVEPPVVPPVPEAAPSPAVREVPVEPRRTSFDVNLMPAELREVASPRKKLIILGVAVGLSILVVFGVNAGLALHERSIRGEVEILTKETESLNQGIASFEGFQREVLALKGQLSLIEQLLNQHSRWTSLFTALERTTLPEVYYGSFLGDVGGKVTLAASAKDLTAFSRQLLIFRNSTSFVRDVNVTGVKIVDGVATAAPSGSGTPPTSPSRRVDFTVYLTVKPEVFTSLSP